MDKRRKATFPKYVKRPQPHRSEAAYAAKYQKGEDLGVLQKVAEKMGGEVAEAPELGVLVVQYQSTSDLAPAHASYEVVQDGHFLVYSPRFDVLFTMDSTELDQEYEEA